MNTDWWRPFVPARAQWKWMALPALLALVVATSVAPASPADAASLRGDRAQAATQSLRNCLDQAAAWGVAPGDPCVYLVRLGPTDLWIAFSPNDGKRHGPWDNEYHIRWSEIGRPEQTVNTGTDEMFMFGNLKPGTTY